VVDEAWLRAFGRLPTAAEQQLGRQHVSQAQQPSAGLRDLLWALLNSKEFIVNH
jgi:hypothetical protein